jgi:hypothetical protein
MNASVIILLLVAFCAANLPFFTHRIFFVIAPKSGTKNFAWQLAEIVALYFLVGGLARWFETRTMAAYQQHWEFYAVTFCLFLVFAYPGFVYKYLWRKRS